MPGLLHLFLLRMWCRTNQSWLSFNTVDKERFLVNPSGYFIELPDGSLNPISPRMTFPASDRLPALALDCLETNNRYGDDTQFVATPMIMEKHLQPQKVDIDTLQEDPLDQPEFKEVLDKSERYVLMRALETGLVSKSGFSKMLEMRSRFKTIGSALVLGGICPWEVLLGYCLDTRPASSFDPPALRSLLDSREWELTGEILFSLGKIKRKHLEYAVKLKGDGFKRLGDILLGMNACQEADIERAVKIQTELKQTSDPEVALIGKLLVEEGVISLENLDDALSNQKIARQPLAKILVSMGVCTQMDIDSFLRAFGLTYQSEIDDDKLSDYLLKIDALSSLRLEEARRIQHRGRQRLGEFLVASGLCDKKDVERVVELQRQIRSAHSAQLKQLGSILVHLEMVSTEQVDETLQRQQLGRQPFGEILTAMQACSADDVREALELQEEWRARGIANDRLGEVLIDKGIITERDLQEALSEQKLEGKPLGHILINRKFCTPELIIEVLIERDLKRHQEFQDFIRKRDTAAPAPALAAAEKNEKKASLVSNLTSWFSRTKES